MGGGRLAGLAVSWIHPDDAGLHPLLALAFGMRAFGMAAVLADSGFLAVDLAGILPSSRPIVVRGFIRLSESSFTMMIVLE